MSTMLMLMLTPNAVPDSWGGVSCLVQTGDPFVK